jgi:hypothetical protein
VKELYLKVLEQHAADLIEAGVSESEAYEQAGKSAYDHMPEVYADLADAAKMRAKEGL